MSTALSMTSPPNPPAPSSGNDFTPLKKPINKGFSPFYCPLWQQNGNLFKYPKSKELTDFHKSVSSFCLSYSIKWFIFFYVNYLQLRIYSCLVKPAPKKKNATENLKATDMLAWVQAMNNIVNQAREIVCFEIITK